MTDCTDMETRLNDLLDGVLDPGRRLQVQAHVRDCGACARIHQQLTRLRTETAALPREVLPPADLWGQVAAETTAAPRAGFTRSRRNALPLGLGVAAAAAAVVAVVVLMAGGESGGPVPLPSRAAAVPAAAGAVPSPEALTLFREAAGRYREAAEALQQALTALGPNLPPDAQAALDTNLALIDSSIADTEQLMQAQPDRPEHGHRLLALHQQKLDVLDGASRWGFAQ